MSNSSLKYQLLAELLRSLEAEGFVLGTGKHLQMQELLGKLPEMEVKQLKGILAPVICTNEKEQELFYTVFDQSLDRVKTVNQSVDEPKSVGDSLKKWIWLLAIPVVLTTAFLLKQFLIEEVVEKTPLELSSISFTINPDSTKVICLEDRLDEEIKEKFTAFILSSFEKDNIVQEGATEKGNYKIENISCLRYSAKDNFGQDSIRLFLIDSLEHKTTVVFYPNIEVLTSKKESPDFVGIVGPFETKPYPYPNDIRSLEFKPLSRFANFYSNNHTWLKPLFILLLGALLWTIIKYRDAKRKKLVAELESKNKAPYVWNIKIDDVENIKMNDAFYSVLNKLRQRTADEATRLNIPKTIEATIEKGGMANFKYSRLTRPPEYLLLIDQQSGSNHRAKVFDFLYRAFHENEIIIERFFFDGDPRLCYNEAHPKGLNIKDLYHHYYNSRLLMMTNGYSLLSPYSGKLAKWTSLFDQWKQRSILTPIANEAWGKRENRLDESFDILPATLQGLDFLVEQLDAGEDGDFNNWKEKIKDAPKETIQLQGGLITSLRHYYTEDMVEWIAACAVYPSMHWDLTLHIGELLSRSDKNLLTIDNLIEMVRLPWFSEGEMPQAARARLLAYLEESHPETLQKVRVGLHELLQKNQPPNDSVAFEDHQMNVALNEWLLTNDKKRKKELEQDIAQHLDAGIEADFTVIKYLDRERTPLDFIVPNAWKKYVHKGGHVGLGMKDVWKDIFYWALPIMLLLSGLMMRYHPEDVCEGELVTYELEDENEILLCLNSPADKILLHEYLAKKANEQGDDELVDSLIRATNRIAGIENVEELLPGLGELNLIRKVDFTSEDSLAYDAFFKNMAIDYYNYAADFANFAYQYKEENDLDNENTVRLLACSSFSRAFVLNNKDADIRRGKVAMCDEASSAGAVKASLSISTSECCAPCKIEFFNKSVNATKYEWDFDDGSITVPVNDFESQNHVFFRPGTYTVKLKASNEKGSDEYVAEVKVKECDENSDATVREENVAKYETVLEEIYESALSEIESKGVGVCKKSAESSIRDLNKFKSKVSFNDNDESNQTALGSFRDAADFLVSVVEDCHSGRVEEGNGSSTEQKEKEAEEIYKNTLASLEKFLDGGCKKVAEKSIKSLSNYKKEVVFYGMQTAIDNPERENQKVLDNFRNQCYGLVSTLRKCENSFDADQNPGFGPGEGDGEPIEVIPETDDNPAIDPLEEAIQKNINSLKKEFQILGNTASKCLKDPHFQSIRDYENLELVGTSGVTEDPKKFLEEYSQVFENVEQFIFLNVEGEDGVVKDIKNKEKINYDRYKELMSQIKRYDKRLNNYRVLCQSIKIKESNKTIDVKKQNNLLNAFQELLDTQIELENDSHYQKIKDYENLKLVGIPGAIDNPNKVVKEFTAELYQVVKYIESYATIIGKKNIVGKLKYPKKIDEDKYDSIMIKINFYDASLRISNKDIQRIKIKY